MTHCTTAACPGLTGELYLTGEGWVTYCPVCREKTAEEAVGRQPDNADKLAAEAYTLAETQEYAKAEEKLMQAAGLAADEDRRRFYLWYALLCRYGVYYVREELYATIPARRTNLFVPTFGRFSLPDYRIRKCEAYKQLALMQMPQGAAQAVNELYTLLLEIEDCIGEEENRFKIFVAWHDRTDDPDGPCRTFARKLNDRLNARRMFSFASFSALSDMSVSHYEPHIYAALATARVMVIVIDDYDALGKKFLASEIVRFLTRRRDDRSLQIYFVGLQGHVGEVPASLTGISGWQKHIEDARDDVHCYGRVVSELQRVLERQKSGGVGGSMASERADRPVAEPVRPVPVQTAPPQAANVFAAIREKVAQYNRAVQLMESGDYDGASKAFAAAGDYRDAAERVYEPYYVQAEKMLEDGETDAAAAMFAALGELSFRDAAERAKEASLSADEMNERGKDYSFGRGVEQDYAKAAMWYRKAAEAGHADGMYNMGRMYHYGYGVTKDYAEAVKWYRKAAEAGLAAGMNNLGYMYQKGYGVTHNYAEAMKWYRKAAVAGHAGGMNNLGYMYRNGYGVTQDNAEAVKWYRKAAEAGLASGMNNLGIMYQNGYGVTQDYAEAVKWYRKAAEAGHADGMNNLGDMYYYGKGVSEDYEEAVKWYSKAAEAGNADGMNNLGYMYEYGYGATGDYVEAVKWYSKAAEAGNADGMNNLGYMYQEGYGVTEDYAEAVKWYRKAAEAGNAAGMNSLGIMYQCGYGVTQDYAEAVKWYRKAAEAGHADGMNNLGDMYYYGKGVSEDYEEAVKWYRKAAEAGDALGMRDLGWMYEHGYGVPQDKQKAKEYYLMAREAGYDTTNALARLGI